MISPALHFGLLQATAMKHDYGAAMFNANQGMMNALASVGPNTDPVVAAQFGRALELQAVHSRVMFQAAMALQLRAQKMADEAFKHERRMMGLND